MFKQTNLIFWGFAVVFFGVGICLSKSLESNLTYWIAYGLFIISSALNIQMFENNPIHKKLGWIGMIIATVIIGLIAAYLVMVQPESELMKLCQQPELKMMKLCEQPEPHQPVLTISAGISSFLFTCSLFLLSFVVSNIKK